MANEAERARAGATFMDAHVPGWAWKIDRKRLNLAECTGCVIGQTLGRYADSIAGLGITDEQEIAYGFEHSMNWAGWENFSQSEVAAKNQAIDAEYAALTSAWLAEIDARLAPAPVPTEAAHAHA